MKNDNRLWLSAADACARLGVRRATLYAYVSRGYLRSQAIPGPSRQRRYSHDDLERLRRRTEERRNPDKAAASFASFSLLSGVAAIAAAPEPSSAVAMRSVGNGRMAKTLRVDAGCYLMSSLNRI